MTEILTAESLLGLRLGALGLAGSAAATEREAQDRAEQDRAGSEQDLSGADRIAATARRMLAVQGQDWRSARWALGMRTPGTTVAHVHEAFDRGLVVRSWPMRGTIHVVAAEDIGWLQEATNHRVLAGAPKRRAFLGMSDAALDRLVETSLAALAGGAALDRDELSAAWTEAGIEWQSSWRYHVIWWICQNGLAVFGPTSAGGEPLLVRADEWIRAPRARTGDDALAELATRYTAARGPVSAKDLAWWSGLTLRETRQALALAAEAGGIVAARLGDTSGPELWLAPEQLAAAPSLDAESWLLLPAFDEHLLGYTERAAQLAPEHFERVVPGRNGMFLGTVAAAGRTRGTWRRSTRARGGVEVSPFPGETIDAASLAPRVAEWCAFHGVPELPLEFPTPAGEPAPGGRGVRV